MTWSKVVSEPEFVSLTGVVPPFPSGLFMAGLNGSYSLLTGMILQAAGGLIQL